MVLTLHGYSGSTATHRVRIVLNEKNVPFSFVEVDLAKREQNHPDYVAKHPFGVVPYIDDDGFILYGSRAICRHIATKYESQGPKLIPTDPRGAANFNQAASIEVSYFDPYVGGIVWEKVVKPKLGLAPDETLIAEHVRALNEKLDVYDVILNQQKYLAGDEFTLVDIFHLPRGSWLSPNGVHLLEEKPNVARWWKDVSSRPSWLAVQADINASGRI